VVAANLTRPTAADAALTYPARESAAPATGGRPADVVTDVIVVGGGGGGLPTALFSRWLGNEVVLLEKAPELGGTAKKAAFWYWVPNNEPMRALGIVDEEPDFLRYVLAVGRRDPDAELPEPLAARERAPRSREPLSALMLAVPESLARRAA
jgi:glycine/D-amino acid oxidase-like deaminating enzyme